MRWQRNRMFFSVRTLPHGLEPRDPFTIPPKTVAKLQLSLKAEQLAYRSFVSVVSLVLFAQHTTQLNPAKAFRLLRAYWAMYRQITRGYQWDDLLAYLDPLVHQELLSIGHDLCENEWWKIAAVRRLTYQDTDCNLICYSDASAAGWSAIVYNTLTGRAKAYQQRWIHDIHVDSTIRTPEENRLRFNAKLSAHAEPKKPSTPYSSNSRRRAYPTRQALRSLQTIVRLWWPQDTSTVSKESAEAMPSASCMRTLTICSTHATSRSSSFISREGAIPRVKHPGTLGGPETDSALSTTEHK